MHHFKICGYGRFFPACWSNWVKWRLIIKCNERGRENSYAGKSTINIFLRSLTQPCNTSPRAAERIIQSFYELSKKCLQFHPKYIWLFFFLKQKKKTTQQPIILNSAIKVISSLWRDSLRRASAASNKCSTFILTLLEEFDWNYICRDNTQQSAPLAFVSRYFWKQQRRPWMELLFQFRTSFGLRE